MFIFLQFVFAMLQDSHFSLAHNQFLLMLCSLVLPNASEIRNKWINALIVFTGKPVIRTEDSIP